jgi:CTP:molybdopterin cytidylyltransferase MocA
MGRPKALLPVRGRTFVRAIVETLRGAGLSRVVVVIRPGARDLADEVLRAGAEVAINADPDRGQLSSLLTGLVHVDAPDVEAALVTLVDVPLVSAAAVAALLERARASACPIVRAAHRGRHGHPVIFARAVFDALRAADLSAGAKPVMRAYAVEDVEVEDAGSVEDIDTPEDYQRLLG